MNRHDDGAGPEGATADAADGKAQVEQTPARPDVMDPARLMRPVLWMLYLNLGMWLIGFVSDGMQYRFLWRVDSGLFVSELELFAAADFNDQRQMAIAAVHLIVVLLCMIIVGRWIYYSSRNLRAFGATGLTIRPGWAVGWYFIPIANLWKPYQAMSEIWRASADPDDWRYSATPPILPVWWALWISTSVLDRILARQANRAESLEEMMSVTTFSLAASVLFVVLMLVFIRLVKQVAQLQIEAIQGKHLDRVFA